MTYLLDVNVLIAALDKDHEFHDLVQDWFAREHSEGWATCPITENGLIRIFGHSQYPKGPRSPLLAAQLLAAMIEQGSHEFWPDAISLLHAPGVQLAGVSSVKRVTDTYLLALAVAGGGKLATLDRRLSPDAVHGGAAALHVIG